MDPPDAATHALTGAFTDRALEAEFVRAEFDHGTGRFLRFSLALSAAVFLAYGLHDAWVVPAIRATAWAIRYGVFAPVAAAVLALARTRGFARWHQPAALAYGMAANLVVLWIGALAPPDGYFLYTSFAVLFVTLGPFIARMDVPTQAAYTVLTLALYNALAVATGRGSLAVRLSLNLTLLSLGGIGALVARQLGAQAREGFLQRRVIRAQVAELTAERGKSDALLLNVLPASIAERLKADGHAIADGFAEVTVLFADIVGFTALAERLAPEEVVRLLNAVFSAFDDLAAAHGLEKIKTIGDAYMVAGGLPEPLADHAGAVAEMALGMLRVVADVGARGGDALQVRIGVHTGPAVAGVIGRRKFIYDVWGDTVNTASRMESHGMPGTIQVSAATYERIRDAYVCECRGEIEVKGKGAMTTWLLVGRREERA